MLMRNMCEMNNPIASGENQSSNNFRIIWQSALASGLCLGLPITLMFWVLVVSRFIPSKPLDSFLILLQDTWNPLISENAPPAPLNNFLMNLQMHVTPPVIVLTLGVLAWAYL